MINILLGTIKNKKEMADKHELTENLKVLETEIYNARSDLRCINSKLEFAYQYEDDLVRRQVAAKKNTEAMRKTFFKKSSEISEMYNKMKNIFDVFTGNHYRD